MVRAHKQQLVDAAAAVDEVGDDNASEGDAPLPISAKPKHRKGELADVREVKRTKTESGMQPKKQSQAKGALQHLSIGIIFLCLIEDMKESDQFLGRRHGLRSKRGG